MRNIFTLFFVLSSLILEAQNNKGVDFSNQKNSLILKSIRSKDVFFGLNTIVKASEDIIYRFWYTKYCIEVSKSDNKIKGEVIFAIQNAESQSEYFRKTFLLNDKQVENIFAVIKKYKIDDLLTDDKVKGWEHGFDGNIFSIESSVDHLYTYKSYWTPEIQVIPEAKTIMDIKIEVQDIIDTVKLNNEFDEENTIGCYKYWGAAYSVCHFPTKNEKRERKK